jgi:hypothetical protein
VNLGHKKGKPSWSREVKDNQVTISKNQEKIKYIKKVLPGSKMATRTQPQTF